jgi:predicted transposase/invertase (TIGR01784 family)
MKDFFETNASEVVNMLLAEWNLDDAKKVWWEEALEEGMEKGLEKGLRHTATNLKKTGMPLKQIADVTGLPMAKLERL